jgi:isoquinoline 1-oxidoreductase beta subunit
MSKIENVSRRKFLKNVGVSSTALVLGVQFSSMLTLPKAFAQSEASDKFEPNVYIQIGKDNVVGIVVHRSEMGQGIRTSIPMIVADELEADWENIDVIQGLGDKKYGSQNTDGSRSVRNFYQPLREAGASARMMLEQAAAQLWQVPVAQCYANNNYVHLQGSAKKAAFGELVDIASTLAIPAKEQLKLKDKSEFKFIGKPNVASVDGLDIATGKAIYGFDVELPNMLFAVIARPPILASKVKSFDASATKKIAGVVDVIQLADVEEPVVFKPLGGIAVIATNTWAAIKGREALKIEWQESEHNQYNSDSYKKALAKSCDNPAQILRDFGDVGAGFSSASRIFSADYYVPELIHVPMEPPAATAHYHNGVFDIWACTQTPQSAQSTVAQITDTPPEKVNINVTLLGGGFGRKSKPDFIVEAAILSKKLLKPIKVLWTREDEIQYGYYHAVSYQKLKAGIDESIVGANKVTAWQHVAAEPPIGSTFAKGADTATFEGDLGLTDMPYNISNIQCATGKAPAHTRIGWMRSVTNINHAFAASSFADELANEMKMDSKDYLLSLIGPDRHIDLAKQNVKYGNYGETTDEFPIDTARLKTVLKNAAAMANWNKKRPAGRGLGIAVHRSFVSYVACVVEVSTQANGKIKLEHIWMSVDCGTAVNPERIKSQMEGSAVFGISLAFFGEVTAKNGVIEQSNFDGYPLARIGDIPTTDIEIVASDEPPGGVGEPGVPPIAPAICNAIFNATGKRYRELPLNQYGIV